MGEDPESGREVDTPVNSGFSKDILDLKLPNNMKKPLPPPQNFNNDQKVNPDRNINPDQIPLTQENKEEILPKPNIIHNFSDSRVNPNQVQDLLEQPSRQLKRIDWSAMNSEDESFKAFRLKIKGIIRFWYRNRLENSDGNEKSNFTLIGPSDVSDEAIDLVSDLVADALIETSQATGETNLEDLNFVIEKSSSSYQPFLDTVMINDLTLVSALVQADKLTNGRGLFLRGYGVGNVVADIAHEIYHRRQFVQDPHYLGETLEANRQNKKYGNRQAYDFDTGELAASAFALRYLLEKHKLLESGDYNPLLQLELQESYIHGIKPLILNSAKKRNFRLFGKSDYASDDDVRRRAKEIWKDRIRRNREPNFRRDDDYLADYLDLIFLERFRQQNNQ